MAGEVLRHSLPVCSASASQPSRSLLQMSTPALCSLDILFVATRWVFLDLTVWGKPCSIALYNPVQPCTHLCTPLQPLHSPHNARRPSTAQCNPGPFPASLHHPLLVLYTLQVCITLFNPP